MKKMLVANGAEVPGSMWKTMEDHDFDDGDYEEYEEAKWRIREKCLAAQRAAATGRPTSSTAKKKIPIRKKT